MGSKTPAEITPDLVVDAVNNKAVFARSSETCLSTACQLCLSIHTQAITISSIDHDGLGRYGDPLNPHGDLRTMQWLKCLVKPGGLLFVSVPVGPDIVAWNLHRRYGGSCSDLLHGTVLVARTTIPVCFLQFV